MKKFDVLTSGAIVIEKDGTRCSLMEGHSVRVYEDISQYEVPRVLNKKEAHSLLMDKIMSNERRISMLSKENERLISVILGRNPDVSGFRVEVIRKKSKKEIEEHFDFVSKVCDPLARAILKSGGVDVKGKDIILDGIRLENSEE